MGDYESDLSDEEETGQEVSAWLEEEDPEEDEPVVKVAPVLPPKIDIVHKSEYIVANLDLFYALCELEDWEFENLPDIAQEDLMKSLIVEEYRPGESIIVEGDTGNDLYIIVATEKTAATAEVEVVNQNILAGTEVFLTRLRRGQFFGQKFFVTRRVVSIIPSLAPCADALPCRTSAGPLCGFLMNQGSTSKWPSYPWNTSTNGRAFAICFWSRPSR